LSLTTKVSLSGTKGQDRTFKGTEWGSGFTEGSGISQGARAKESMRNRKEPEKGRVGAAAVCPSLTRP